MKIFVTIDAYLPGYRFGGPVRSVANLVEWLGGEYEFFIYTKDRDLGDERPYPEIRRGEWQDVGKARVYYARPENHSGKDAQRLIREVEPDAVYLNGLWERVSRQLCKGRESGVRYIIAPRGALGQGALGVKPLKKKLGLLCLRHRLRGVNWHATTADEAGDIRRAFPGAGDVVEAPNLMSQTIAEADPDKVERTVGHTGCRMVAFSRISRKKNFGFLLKVLERVNASIDLDVIGPAEDPEYLQELERASDRLEGKTVRFLGGRSPEELSAALPDYDFFVLPTKHENFGHVFVEAWAAGLPVITSDQTPWRGLEARGVGWDLPLSNEAAWRDVLKRCAAMPPEERRSMRRKAMAFARELVRNQPVGRYEILFGSSHR